MDANMKLCLIAHAFAMLLSSSCDNHPNRQEDSRRQFESQEAGKQLDRYARAVIGKIKGGDRVKGAYPGMTVDESVFADMWYFWQTSIEKLRRRRGLLLVARLKAFGS